MNKKRKKRLCFNHICESLTEVCSCACHTVNIQQQQSCDVARKPRDAAVVL